MPLSSKLWVLPDTGRVEEAMVRAASSQHGFVDGSAYCTFGQLVDRCEGAEYLGRRRCAPLTSRVVLWSCAQELGTNPFGAFVHEPGFARSALELIFELKKGMLSPSAFAEAAGGLPTSRREDARYLARLYAAYERRLKSLRLADREDRLHGASQALRKRGLPSALAGVDQVQIDAIYDWPPLRLDFLLALAEACDRRGISFRLVAPASGSDRIDMTVDQALAELERRGQLLQSLELLKWDGASEQRPLAKLGPLLFSGGTDGSSDSSLGRYLTLFSAPNPRDEARQLARSARDALDRGLATEQVAIAYPELREEAEWAVEALEDLGVPARVRRGAPLASTGAGRTALELAKVVEEGFPAPRVARLLTSRYLPEVSRGTPDSPATLLALASVRDDVVGAADGRGAYDVRLSALIARLENRGNKEQAREVAQVLERCKTLISALEQIPRAAPAATLLGRWWRTLQQLGFQRAFRQPEPRDAEASALGRAVLRSLARDQSASEALAEMGVALQESLRLAAADVLPLTRRVLQRWLDDAALDFNLAPKSPRSGAVQVLEVRELPGRSFKRVLIGGMTDGRFPGRKGNGGILSLEDRFAINRAAQRNVFRCWGGDGDGRIDWRLAEDRLLFYLGLTASEAEVTLSYSRTGTGGEPQLPSPFLEEVARLTGSRIEPFPLQSVPRIAELASEPQLRVRAVIEALIPAELRIEEPEPAGGAFALQFKAEGWFRQAEELAAIERQRLRFFSNAAIAPGPFSGRIGGEDVKSALESALSFGSERPISASTLARFGNCAFQGFLRDLVRVGAFEAAGEEMDPKDRGSFWHRVMEVLFPRLKKEGLLNRPVSQIAPQILEEALEEASHLAEQSTHVGHPALWNLGRERARAIVKRLLDTDHRGLPFEGQEPIYAELRFGHPEALEGWREVKIPGGPGEKDIFIEGKIDRLDSAEGGLGVVDYKSGSVPTGKRMAERLLATEFQLPLYLHAAQVAGMKPAQGAWLSLKDGRPFYLAELLASYGEQTLEEMLSMDPEVRARLKQDGKKNLANAIQALVRRLREGDFGIRPLDCSYCSYRSVCRITERRLYEGRDG